MATVVQSETNFDELKASEASEPEASAESGEPITEQSPTTDPASLAVEGAEKLQARRARLWSVLYCVLTACVMSLMVGATLAFSSPVLLELTQLQDPQFRFNVRLSDIFGVSNYTISKVP